MATMQEIIDRAVDIAAGAVGGPLQDATVLAESLLPEVLQAITARVSASERTRTILRKTVTVAIAANSGVLPDEALTEYICEADILDTNGDRAAWCRYNTLVNSPDPRLAWLAVKEGPTVSYLPVGGGAYTADLFVTLPCAPVLPAASTDQLVMPAEVLDDVVLGLATALVSAVKGAQ